MKTIYVTVAEFLENGGQLIPGRKIYNQYDFLSGEYRRNSLTDKTKFIIETDHGDTYGHFADDKVEVECTPIYA